MSSKVFSQYRSRISPVDFQAIARNLQQATDTEYMNGTSLDKRPGAPTMLSQAGFDVVKRDVELTRLEELCVTASDACRIKLGTIRAARSSGDRTRKEHLCCPCG